jgi:LysM repeat protein
MKVSAVIFLIAISLSSFGQTVKMGGKSSHKYDTHLVMKGETLYSVSKKFNTTVSELLKLNPDIVNNNLQEGKTIKVPVSKTPLGESQSGTAAKHETPILHEVTKGETVYSLSKKYNTDVQTILMWNNLPAPSIKTGEKIIVGYEAQQLKVVGPLTADEKIPASEKEIDQERNSDKEAPSNKVSTVDENSSMKFHSEKGIATWSQTTYDDGNFYALFPSAPIGTQITVKNMMNNKTVSVKVIGKLPATAENENVMIRISESAAKQLNALDEKFLVEINYNAEDLSSLSGTN